MRARKVKLLSVLAFLLQLSFSGICGIAITRVHTIASPTYDTGAGLGFIAFYEYKWERYKGPDDDNPVPPGYAFYGAFVKQEGKGGYWVAQSSNIFTQYHPNSTYIRAVQIEPGMTWKQVEEKWLQSAGGITLAYISEPIYLELGNTFSINSCLKFVATNSTGLDQERNPVANGNAPCAFAPPVENPNCGIAGDVNLDFGTLGSGNVTGATATKTVALNCSLNATIRLTDAYGNQGVVDLGGGLKATTKIDGQALPVQNKSVTAGTTNLVFTAELEGSNATPGTYSGSYPLIIEYQ